MKIPLLNPNRMLDRLLPVLGWTQSPFGMGLGLVVMFAAAIALAANFNQWQLTGAGIWDRDNWLWLGVTWVALKVIHELAHALACKRYGGAVHETGLIFILFAPMAYVDVTSSWKFRSRRERIHVAAAGMWVELLVAAIAVLVWSRTSSEVLAHHLLNIFTMAGVTTLLFNANPLMRFDGYFILSDLLEIPNLYGSGAQAVSGMTRRLLLGHPMPKCPESGWRKGVVFLYGPAAFCWRMLICISLMVGASVLFHGFGVLLTGLAVLLWFGRPALAGLKRLRSEWQINRFSVVRAMSLLLVVGGGLAFLLLGVPCPGRLTAPGVVEYTDRAVIRPASAGFVRDVLVESGQWVEADALLLRLENDEITTELADLTLAIEQSEHRRLQFLDKREVGRGAGRRAEPRGAPGAMGGGPATTARTGGPRSDRRCAGGPRAADAARRVGPRGGGTGGHRIGRPQGTTT